ncbi:MAG TPA: hypothetical protein H9781_07895 [Candidatus Oscillibacter excrementavium]|nr:hypothetical protein [Candidatus Oscillibacter excrementavium]
METLTALAEVLHTDIRELIYGPEQAAYARFQRRYIVCTAVCVLVLLAWLIMEWTLEPYLTRLREETYELYPGLFYTLLVPPLASAAAGVLIPSAISMWGDIRIRSQKLRRCLLVLGLLALLPQLLLAAWCLNLLPDFMVHCRPLQLWLVSVAAAGNGMLQESHMFLSGCLLFLGLNR